MRTATIAMVALAVGLGTWPRAVHSEEPTAAREQSASRAERILADESLFAAEFAERVHKLMPLVASGGVKSFGLRVPPDRQPQIADIKDKYGAPDRVDEAPRGPSGPGLPDAPVDMRYTYGPLQFCVPKASDAPRVEFLVIVPLE